MRRVELNEVLLTSLLPNLTLLVESLLSSDSGLLRSQLHLLLACLVLLSLEHSRVLEDDIVEDTVDGIPEVDDSILDVWEFGGNVLDGILSDVLGSRHHLGLDGRVYGLRK